MSQSYQTRRVAEWADLRDCHQVTQESHMRQCMSRRHLIPTLGRRRGQTSEGAARIFPKLKVERDTSAALHRDRFDQWLNEAQTATATWSRDAEDYWTKAEQVMKEAYELLTAKTPAERAHARVPAQDCRACGWQRRYRYWRICGEVVSPKIFPNT